MKTRIVRIGNTRVIRIPKPILEQCGLKDEVELHVRNGSLLITAAKKARSGWATTFRELAKREDDVPLDEAAHFLTQWDQDEWQW